MPEDRQFIEVYITFHTRHLPEFNDFFDKLSGCFDRVKKGDALTEAEKISFREYAILRSIAALKRVVDHLHSHDLAHLQDKVDACHNIVLFLEERKASSSPFKIGMFISQEKELGLTEEKLKHFYTDLNRLVCLNVEGPAVNSTIKPQKG